MSVALLLGLTLALLSAWPASATIHPLSCSENSSAPSGTPAQTQDPPGLTPGGPDQSRAPVAQPVHAILDNPTAKDLNAFKAPGCPR